MNRFLAWYNLISIQEDILVCSKFPEIMTFNIMLICILGVFENTVVLRATGLWFFGIVPWAELAL